MMDVAPPLDVKLEFLGTGTSTGVPVIGCTCEVCTSTDPRDTRTRSSALFHAGGRAILVDTGPDLRLQMLRARPARLDAILYTHMHSDHIVGLDDIRPFNFLQEERLPTWVLESAVDDLKRRFDYAFGEEIRHYGVVPNLALHPFAGCEPLDVVDVPVQPIPVMHGTLPIAGYRIGDIAYLTDVKTLPDEAFPLLGGLDVLVITALRHREHVGHLTLDGALALIDRIGPHRAYLSHCGHELGRYAEVAPTLPDGVLLAYDGLNVS